MRFLYKRPRLEQVDEELAIVMEVLESPLFVFLDLLVFSFIFTMLLFPFLHSLRLSILFFITCYGIFSSFYYFIFYRSTNKC